MSQDPNKNKQQENYTNYRAISFTKPREVNIIFNNSRDNRRIDKKIKSGLQEGITEVKVQIKGLDDKMEKIDTNKLKIH